MGQSVRATRGGEVASLESTWVRIVVLVEITVNSKLQ
jgi:hypothetical protein